MNFRRIALTVFAAAATLAPSIARADIEPLLKDSKLTYSKNGDQFEVNMAISPSQSRRVILVESELGSTGVKYVRVVVIAATYPKNAVPPAVTKMVATKWDKLPLGRVRLIEESLMLLVYENDFFVEGASGANLRLNVELAGILGGNIEKDITAAKGEE